MNTLWWVMGASAVGKKTLIRRAVAETSVRRALALTSDVRAVWMNEGAFDPADVPDPMIGDGLLRWQFGREAAFLDIAAGRMVPGILLVEADPAIHYGQMLAREGARWTPACLAFEVDAVRSMAVDLAQRHGAPLRKVDASRLDYRIREDRGMVA